MNVNDDGAGHEVVPLSSIERIKAGIKNAMAYFEGKEDIVHGLDIALTIVNICTGKGKEAGG